MNTEPGQKSLATGLTLVLIGALGFSVKSIIIKLAYQVDSEIDAISLLALRMAFALPIFLWVIVWQHRKSANTPTLSGKQHFILIILGLMGYYLASYFDFIGLQYISAGLERVILFLYPTFVVVFSAIALKRAISLREIAALAICYCGMILVFIDNLSVASENLIFGSAMILSSAVVFAGFTMGSGVMVQQIGSAKFTAYTMSIAGMAILIHFFITSDTDLTRLPNKVYGLTLIMALFSTVLPAFFMNAGIKRIGAGPASIISSSGPIATLILAFFILNEPVTQLQTLGTMLVLTGVYVTGRAKSLKS